MRATRNGLFRFQSRNRVPLVISDNNISESTFIAPPSMTVQCKPGEQLVMQGDPYSLKMLVRCKTCKPPSYSLRAGTLHGGPTMPYTFTEGIEGEHPCVAHCPNGVDCDQGWGDVFSRPGYWCQSYGPSSDIACYGAREKIATTTTASCATTRLSTTRSAGGSTLKKGKWDSRRP